MKEVWKRSGDLTTIAPPRDDNWCLYPATTAAKLKKKTHEGSYIDSLKMKAVRGLRGRSLHADSHKTKAMAMRMKLSETARGSSMLESFEC